MFMEPQITHKEDWWEMDTTEGAVFLPFSDFSQEQAEQGYDLCSQTTRIVGYGYRLSAPGYLDCTDWNVADTFEDAKEALREMFCQCETETELCELCKALNR